MKHIGFNYQHRGVVGKVLEHFNSEGETVYSFTTKDAAIRRLYGDPTTIIKSQTNIYRFEKLGLGTLNDLQFLASFKSALEFYENNLNPPGFIS